MRTTLGVRVKLALGLALTLGLVLVTALLPVSATAFTLPDGRGYELVTPPEKNGVTTSLGTAAANGNAVDWESSGGCCGSTTGGEELYQSKRGPNGWTTKGLTPVPGRSLEGFLDPQVPVFWTPELNETIFNTVESYDPGDTDEGALDLYLVGESGPPTWISRGPLGGGAPHGVTFDGATPDANTVLFSSQEQLTPDAVGLSSGPAYSQPEYLYARNVSAQITTLVNVTNGDTVIDPSGAILGNGGYIGDGTTAPDQTGTTTNAVSEDGSKVFFESPPPNESEGSFAQAHLYMRDLADATTTPLDNPASEGFARYEGASQDGSLVFFTSNEGLGGDPYTDLELYEFNTTDHAIGPAPAMSVIPLSAGNAGEPPLDGHVLGATAIANDGSQVYFVAEGVLTPSPNGQGDSAAADQPNLYDFDTTTGRTAFVARLAASDVSGTARGGPFTREPDLTRPAIPTADGNALVFETPADVTGENPPGPTSALALESQEQSKTLVLESTAGLIVGRSIEIGTGSNAETDEITAVVNSSEITLAQPLRSSYDAGNEVTQLPVDDVYRYSTEDGSLVCVTCTPPGVPPTSSAILTGVGGTYAPPGGGVTMNADASRIFFMSQEKLVPGLEAGFGLYIYEWENGHLYLIAGGQTVEEVGFLFGTTPSGNDVFFATEDKLVAQDKDGSFDIYDARVGGGFPAPQSAPETCSEPDCRSPRSTGIFLPQPGSATLGEDSIEPITLANRPTLSVQSLTSAQRASFARTGRLTFAVSATARGRVTARAFATLQGKRLLVGSAGVTIATEPGRGAITLRLSSAARGALTRRGRLTLEVEMSYSAGNLVRVARLTLLDQRSRSGRTR
jgi:hypothetical protein